MKNVYICLQFFKISININMEIEDSRNALFVEPNAYITRYEKQAKDERRKVIFQEPYECIPNYYIDNGFKNHKHEINKIEKMPNLQNFSKPKFDLTGFMPILNMLKKDSGGLSGIMSLFDDSNKNGQNGFQSLISSVLGNKDMMGMFSNLFKGFKPKSEKQEKPISTDYEIKNYTRVEWEKKELSKNMLNSFFFTMTI